MKKEITSSPLLLVMTPVRNEAWILHAFLKTTSMWADYIIIADQMSTDGSREIYPQYDKVIVIDNTNPNFNEAERQSMLVTKAREVAAGRDCILFGLDADEIMPANWRDTADGRHILNSMPGDVFWFKWAQLVPDKLHYGDSAFYPWVFHDDGVEPHGNYVRNMHSMRIPYPLDEEQMYYVNDFRVLHCGALSIVRISAKQRFHQFVDWEMNRRSYIQLGRTYSLHNKNNIHYDVQFQLEEEAIDFPFEIWRDIDIQANHTWFDDYIVERLNKYPISLLRKLDIWDAEFIQNYNLKDERRLIDKLIHVYLHVTDKYKSILIFRIIDKVLKWIY